MSGTANDVFATHQMMSAKDIAKLTGLSRAYIGLLMREGQFPKGVRLSKVRTAWRQRDVIEWLESRPEAA